MQENEEAEAELLAELTEEPDEELQADLAPLLEGVRREIAHERGLRAWLRSRPTALRLALAFGAVLVVVGSDAAVNLRHGIGVYPTWWLLTHVVLLGALVGAALVVGLRPLHRPPLTTTVKWSLVGGALLLPVAMAVAPAFFFPLVAPQTGSQIAAAPACFGFGAAMAIPIIVLMRILDRGARDTSILLAGAAAGVAANLLLHNRCAAADPAHLLLGHASVAWFYVGLSAVALRLLARRA